MIEHVNESRPLSRLDMLRFARRVVEQQAARQLALIDRWISDEERRETGRRTAEARRERAADWLIQHGLNRTNVDAVHVGDCWVAKKSGRCRPVSREQAVEALRQQVPACPHCRPDTALGVLD
ncbi:hypothetical protein B446_02780 [Streptomyces collinus Tu 365]|uniref:Uncharacterized protein n=1 Tax=Streptomyces collinus (strain DSM 40733 / Tue 365) TaxID=1214242 RepID=S5UKL9_STRC3|nr:hypothetical protein B446_02780 [Streptomyces collinus Tu 365]